MTLELKVIELIKSQANTEKGFGEAVAIMLEGFTKTLNQKTDETRAFALAQVQKIRADYQQIVTGTEYSLAQYFIEGSGSIETYPSNTGGKPAPAPVSALVLDSILSPRFTFSCTFPAAPLATINPGNGEANETVLFYEFKNPPLALLKSYRGIGACICTADIYFEPTEGASPIFRKSLSFEAEASIYYDLSTDGKIVIGVYIQDRTVLQGEFSDFRRVAMDYRELKFDVFTGSSELGTKFPLRRVK